MTKPSEIASPTSMPIGKSISTCTARPISQPMSAVGGHAAEQVAEHRPADIQPLGTTFRFSAGVLPAAHAHVAHALPLPSGSTYGSLSFIVVTTSATPQARMQMIAVKPSIRPLNAVDLPSRITTIAKPMILTT